ncbi:MAG: cadmium-translocating P-type ATPase [Candidatus Moraniibacteriota bacterium]|nr:MAG: cadmium-translocating P-type ATPase [Candidatus Moranbacteria bacterium]
MTQKNIQVKGMHCASCSAIISKKIKKLSGVEGIEINFVTEKAKIIFDPKKISIDEMNEEIEKIGYRFEEYEENQQYDKEKNKKTSKNEGLKNLLEMQEKVQFVFPITILVFVFMIWDIGAKLFSFIPNIPFSMELFNSMGMIVSTIVLFWIGQPFIQGVIRFVRYRVANMDTLVGIGTMTAYIYSMIITLFPQAKIFFKLPEYTYFDVTIVVIGFVIFGKYLELRSKRHTGEAIEKLLDLQAKTALLWKNGKEIEVPIEEVQIGDVVVVKPGMKIPVDGKIIEGQSTIDESMITGESVFVDRKIGDFIFGATLNKQGAFKCIATKVGRETLLAQIIKITQDAQGSRAPIQDLADKISRVFVPIVLIISLSTLFIWLLFGSTVLGFSSALSYGILSFVGVLVIACPCALGLATPTAIIVGIGKGAERGILIKNSEALENLSKINTIVFDKTGTITKGKLEVTDIIILDSQWKEETILQCVASVENSSEHPLAQAIVRKAKERKIDLKKVENFRALEGIGVKAHIQDARVYVRRPDENDKNNVEITSLQKKGKTVIVVEVNDKKIGLLALADTLKHEAKTVIAQLQKRGIEVVMLTGDSYLTANSIAKQVNIKTVIAGVLPTEKVDKIKELQLQGKRVVMVGDGINDAPALVQSEVGIAMATGSDIAIESADITLLHGDIQKLSQAIQLSQMTMRTVKQNLFWAFMYNIIGIPLAAGLLYPLWGIILNPIFAGLAMAGSSVSVVTNSLRLKTMKLK